jgi:RimJ/RimL family protein N-acetyltransferase
MKPFKRRVRMTMYGKIIGASRFCKPHPDEVPDLTGFEIGYTFLARAFWGNGYNEELKLLMLNHAFQFVDAVQFFIGEFNFRSQRAILKTGATYNRKITSAQLNGSQMTSLVYQLCKSDWPKYALALAASYL